MGQEATHSIPIILLGVPEDAPQMVTDAGAGAFPARPFQMGGLLALVAPFPGNERLLPLSGRRFPRAPAAEQ
jgi:hypothetical protein